MNDLFVFKNVLLTFTYMRKAHYRLYDNFYICLCYSFYCKIREKATVKSNSSLPRHSFMRKSLACCKVAFATLQ